MLFLKLISVLFFALSSLWAGATVAGQLTDPQGQPVVGAHTDSVTVTADVHANNLQDPDPAQRVVVRDEILDANPGRPGAPVSIPGLPIETASGGIKAPQYFAPGVAGDHGEPIATFLQVGSFLVPNNLSANAHGNGYSDPNILIPASIESVQTDGGAFNVREGNHSVDLAETYGMHTKLEPFATLTGDARDVDLSAGWNWLAVEAAYGNGFLDRFEHRQQYKVNVVHMSSAFSALATTVPPRFQVLSRSACLLFTTPLIGGKKIKPTPPNSHSTTFGIFPPTANCSFQPSSEPLTSRFFPTSETA